MVLDRLDSLPDLVLATVFGFLPRAFTDVIARSENAEVAELALRALWRYVVVDRHDPGNRHHMTHGEFLKMVASNTPPLRRIHRLKYVSDYDLDLALLSVPGWCDYLLRYVASVEIRAGFGPHGNWPLMAPHLAELHVAMLLLMADEGCDADTVHAQVLAVTYPDTLTQLALYLDEAEAVSLEMVLPRLLRSLRLSTLQPLSPLELPVLPRGLRRLEYTLPSALDITNHTSVYPCGLEELALLPQYGYISETAMRHFLRLLEHNLVVYRDGTPEKALPRFQVASREATWIELSSQRDYAVVVSIPFPLLGLRALEATPVALLRLNHLFVLLEHIIMHMPLLLAGAVFLEKTSVRINSLSSLEPEVWELARVVALDLRMGAVLAFPDRLALMVFLKELTLYLKVGGLPVVVPAAPNVLDLTVNLQHDAAMPDFLQFALVRYMMVRYATGDFVLDVDLLPLCVRVLVCHYLGDYGHHAGEVPFLQHQSLCHLECLEKLKLSRMPYIRLGEIELPDSLREIKCSGIRQLCLADTQLPSGLRRLELGASSCTAPEEMVFPEGLELLRLGGLQTFAVARCALPGLLRLLYAGDMQWALLKGVRFPPGLVELTLRGVGDPWAVQRTYAFLLVKLLMLLTPMFPQLLLVVESILPPGWQWEPVVYPEGLETLHVEFDGVEPPEAFVFPLGLRTLRMVGCGIRDITPYHFPASLEMLDVSENGFPVPEEYEWPPLRELSVWEDSGTDFRRSAAEGKVLRRIPGAHIRGVAPQAGSAGGVM